MKNIPLYLPMSGEEPFGAMRAAFDLQTNIIEELEEEYKKFSESSFILSTINNFTAMHLGLCAMELRRGDKVICPINSQLYIPSSIRQFDAEPVFVDIEESSLLPSAKSVEEYCKNNSSKKLTAIVIPHHCSDKKSKTKLYEIAKKYNMAIIEDATTTTHIDAKEMVADLIISNIEPEIYGSLSSTSFLSIKDQKIYEKALSYRYYALHTTPETGYYAEQQSMIDVIDIGCKYDISRLSAAHSMYLLTNSENNFAALREISTIYEERLGSLPHVVINKNHAKESHYMYLVKIDKNRDSFARALKEEGVSTGVYFMPLNLTGYYKTKYNLKINEFPNALKLFQQAMLLPYYPSLEYADAQYVCDKIEKISKEWI